MAVRSRSPTHQRLKRLAALCLQAGPLKMNLQAMQPPKHGQMMASGASRPLWQHKKAGQTQVVKRRPEESLQTQLPLSRGLAQDLLPALQPMMFAHRKVGRTLLRMPKPGGVRSWQTLAGGNRPRQIGRTSNSMARSTHGATIVAPPRTQATSIPVTCLPWASDRATRRLHLHQIPPNGIRRQPPPHGRRRQMLRSGCRCLLLLTTWLPTSRVLQLRINGRVVSLAALPCPPTPRPMAHHTRTRCHCRSPPR